MKALERDRQNIDSDEEDEHESNDDDNRKLPTSPSTNSNRSKTTETDTAGTNDYSLILFDSITIEFSILIWLKQFFIHVLYPFLNFTTAAEPQQFTNVGLQSLFFTVVHPACIYTMIITYYLSTDSYINGGLYFPLLYYILHKVVVATKYACLSRSEYRRFMTSPTRFSSRYRKQMELISGWLFRDPLVLDFEVGAAIARCGLRPTSRLSVRIGPRQNKSKSSISSISERNLRIWLRYLQASKADDSESDSFHNKGRSAVNLTQDISGTYVSIFDVCTAIIKRCDQKEYFYSQFTKLLYILSIVNTLMLYLPLIDKAMDGSRMAMSWYTIIFYCVSTIISFPYFGVVVSFMYIGLFDVARQLNMLATLREMIRVSDVSTSVDINLTFNEERVNDETSWIQREIQNRIISRRKGGPVKNAPMNISNPSFDSSIGIEITSPLEDLNVLPSSSKGGGKMRTHMTDGYAASLEIPIPKIKLDCPDNVLAFVYMRMLLCNFGARFRFRLQAYATIVIAIAIILIAFSLFTAITSSEPRLAYNTIVFRQSFIAVSMIFVYLLILVSVGSNVNDCLEEHR